MISHKHKSIFIHIPKAAGSSIEHMFINDLDWDKKKARMPFLLLINSNGQSGPPRLSHLSAKEFLAYNYVSKEMYDKYFTFGWVRNPYGRIYSFYKYFCYDYFVSFEKFVTFYLTKNFHNKKTHYFYKPMYDYLYIGNELAVDFVGKLESIENDIETVIINADIEKKQLPHQNKSSNIRFKLKMRRIFDIIRYHPSVLLHYTFSKNKKKKEYTPTMKKVMRELYDKDFENFGYEF